MFVSTFGCYYILSCHWYNIRNAGFIDWLECALCEYCVFNESVIRAKTKEKIHCSAKTTTDKPKKKKRKKKSSDTHTHSNCCGLCLSVKHFVLLRYASPLFGELNQCSLWFDVCCSLHSALLEFRFNHSALRESIVVTAIATNTFAIEPQIILLSLKSRNIRRFFFLFQNCWHFLCEWALENGKVSCSNSSSFHTSIVNIDPSNSVRLRLTVQNFRAQWRSGKFSFIVFSRQLFFNFFVVI